MLREFGSRHFAAESLRADAMEYGHHRLGSYVLHHHHHHPCYPNEPGENAFNIAWDHQQPYHHHHHSSASAYHQPALHANPDVAGFFNSVAGGSFLSRPALSHHLRHQHSAHSGPSNKQAALVPANASGSGPKVKPRRRVASVSQRRAANIRERRRMYSLNTEFDRLRKKVPTFAYEKKLSRIDTLRLAITYISFMKEVLRDGASGPDERALLGPFGGNAGPNSDLGPLCNEILWSAKPQIN